MKKLKQFKVTINCDIECPIFNAYYDPTNKYWNGWCNPYFDKENRDNFIGWLKSWINHDKEYMEEITSTEPTVNGLYYFGSSIVWEEA